MGMLYKRGEIFWVKYYSAGQSIRESTGTTKQREAERFLKHCEGRSAAGQPLELFVRRGMIARGR